MPEKQRPFNAHTIFSSFTDHSCSDKLPLEEATCSSSSSGTTSLADGTTFRHGCEWAIGALFERDLGKPLEEWTAGEQSSVGAWLRVDLPRKHTYRLTYVRLKQRISDLGEAMHMMYVIQL